MVCLIDLFILNFNRHSNKCIFCFFACNVDLCVFNIFIVKKRLVVCSQVNYFKIIICIRLFIMDFDRFNNTNKHSSFFLFLCFLFFRTILSNVTCILVAIETFDTFAFRFFVCACCIALGSAVSCLVSLFSTILAKSLEFTICKQSNLVGI